MDGGGKALDGQLNHSPLWHRYRYRAKSGVNTVFLVLFLIVRKIQIGFRKGGDKAQLSVLLADLRFADIPKHIAQPASYSRKDKPDGKQQ